MKHGWALLLGLVEMAAASYLVCAGIAGLDWGWVLRLAIVVGAAHGWLAAARFHLGRLDDD